MDGAGCFRALVALLDVSPQHRLLDMSGTCSGSLAEALHAAGPGRGLSLSGQVPPGLLIANAPRPELLDALVAEVLPKFRSPVVFTCCPPQSFPQIAAAKHPVTQEPPEVREVVLKFDRIMCGVNCSQSSKKHQPWHMHPLQLRTLQRGLQSLAPGGKLIYLTQGSNCIENEAVVAACLSSQASELQLKLIPASHHWTPVSGWPISDGHISWNVPSPDKKNTCSFTSWEEVPQVLRGGKILQTMFPPTSTAELTTSELQKCLRGTNGSSHFFLAIFQKVNRSPPQVPAPSAATMDGIGYPQATLATGTRVVVRATGAPAMVVGPGQRAFKGLVKIRYPDRSTYHVELEDLELQTGAWQSLRTHGCKLAMVGMASLVLSIVTGWNRLYHWRSLWSPSRLLPLLLGAKAMRGRKVPSVFHLSASFLVAFLAWRLLHRKQLQRPVSGPGPGARSVESRPGSRLVKRCAKVPDAVVSFADFFGLECPKLPASPGDHMGLLHLPNLCYRTTDKQTLYLVSPALFELRVPELLRHSLCGMPFLQRCVSSQELNLWGCELRPTLQAAPFLSALGAKRKICLENFGCWRKLLQDGKLRIKDLKPGRQMDMKPGAVILVDKSELLFLIAVLQSDSLQIFLDHKARQDIGTVREKWLW
ncbi:unnamed protein product [Cladocopium goreaui]|uniref:S-adenosyl-L-methionine-dependent methyltransferase n=1 Tax=Cladocopium goreaui TaxID=2562237 RepID=A0A9P1GFW8_9DINO|nr:unnamed protein product [Cladocopium goreaui]